jgi:nucleoside 2-deoxyribosyltransferase
VTKTTTAPTPDLTTLDEQITAAAREREQTERSALLTAYGGEMMTDTRSNAQAATVIGRRHRGGGPMTRRHGAMSTPRRTVGLSRRSALCPGSAGLAAALVGPGGQTAAAHGPAKEAPTVAVQVYLASPLGFAASTRPFMEHLTQELSGLVTVVNPWDDHRFDDALASAQTLEGRGERLAKLAAVNAEIGRTNEDKIRGCDAMIAVLDGVDVDSGTASEIGFAYALGKRVFGLRTDFRLTGDNEAALVNLQVRYWIDASGGNAVTSLGALRTAVGAWTAGGASGTARRVP